MRDATRSIVATGAVIAVIGAIVGGGFVRSRMELGPGVSVGGPIAMETLATSAQGIPGVSEDPKDTIGESTYFYQLTLLLEKEFVDPINDKQSLAIGAVRGMVATLADSDSSFFGPEQMAALKERRSGVFSGIGVEVRLDYNESELRKLQNATIGASGAESDVDYDARLLLPAVRVTAVIPKGPAESAGMRVGDRIVKVDGKWAFSSEELDEVRALRAKFDEGKINERQMQETIASYRARFESQIAPARIVDELLLGKTGSVEVKWRRRDGSEHGATVRRSKTLLPSTDLSGDMLKLRLFSGCAESLRALALPRNLTIDLRQSTIGDFNSVRSCLAILAPSGNYGSIRREQAGAPRLLTVSEGSKKDRTIRLIVDGSTHGAAAVLAEALLKSGRATIAQGELTKKLPWIEVVRLPDGSGYTLQTGAFVAEGASK